MSAKTSTNTKTVAVSSAAETKPKQTKKATTTPVSDSDKKTVQTAAPVQQKEPEPQKDVQQSQKEEVPQQQTQKKKKVDLSGSGDERMAKYESLQKTRHDLLEQLKVVDRELDGIHTILLKTYLKQVENDSKKKNRATPNQIPIEISETLRNFMTLPEGSKKTRTEVFKFVHEYIKENKLGGVDTVDEKTKEKTLDKSMVKYDPKLQVLFKKLYSEQPNGFKFTQIMGALSEHFPQAQK